MDWIKRNLKWITIILLVLLVFKNIQSCNRKNALNIRAKNHTEEITKIEDRCNSVIDSLQSEILARDLSIRDLSADLRVAGVKVEESQKRAEAVQKAAENIRSHTTIEIRPNENDSIKKSNK